MGADAIKCKENGNAWREYYITISLAFKNKVTGSKQLWIHYSYKNQFNNFERNSQDDLNRNDIFLVLFAQRFY